MARQSLAGLLDDFLKRSDEIAYVQHRGYRSNRWSYRQVAETAFQLAQALEARGISKGDRVLIWGPNSAEWVTAFLGCMARGVVVVPMDDAATADFALRVAAQVSAKLIVCSGEHAEAAVSTPKLILEDLRVTLAHHPRTASAALPSESTDTLEIVFTSGTTAEPKGVVISHANVLANVAPLETEAQKYLKYERLVHPVRFLILLPLSHVFGQFLGIFLPQLLGGTVVFQENLKPSDVIATIRRERVSLLVAVPRLLQSLKEKIERDLDDAGCLQQFQRRFRQAEGKHFLRRWWIFRRLHRQFGWKFWAFISGGAALDSQTEEFWGRLGYAVIQGYGLTETTSIVSVNHPFRLGKGSIGKVLAGREVKLAADGEILVRGGGVASGYWDSSGAAVATDDGWYHTGDLGEMDAQGHLYFKGRKKDVIVTPAGMNVYPQDLEAALRYQPEVKDCVVIALPRNGNAEPAAVVILRSGSSDPEPAVRRANESLAEYQRMRFWFVWPEEDFPRTSTQKPRISQIQQFVQSQLGEKTTVKMPSSPLADLIARVSGRSPARLSAESNLESDLNLSSLDRVELLSALEDRYQVDLSEAKFASVNTIGDLEKMLHGEVPARARYHYPRWVLRWPVTWLRLLAYYLVVGPAVFLLAWPRVTGRENLRNLRGPVLVICNHISDVDLGFVLTALPARFCHKLATATGGEALEALRTPPTTRNILERIYDRVQWALGVSLLNLFPLPRAAGFRESFAYAGECIDRGYSVLVFPEGRHTTSGKILPFRAGIGLLAKNLRVPVVPMRIDGLFEVKQAGKKVAGTGKIRVKIGAAVEFSVEHEPEDIARKLHEIVEAL
jgi:long-chain acyl-CoA synthetase